MKELWLEFGYVQDNHYHDLLWYNEGRAEELWYFLKHYIKYRKRKDMYFLWRYGRENHYL